MARHDKNPVRLLAARVSLTCAPEHTHTHTHTSYIQLCAAFEATVGSSQPWVRGRFSRPGMWEASAVQVGVRSPPRSRCSKQAETGWQHQEQAWKGQPRVGILFLKIKQNYAAAHEQSGGRHPLHQSSHLSHCGHRLLDPKHPLHPSQRLQQSVHRPHPSLHTIEIPSKAPGHLLQSTQGVTRTRQHEALHPPH